MKIMTNLCKTYDAKSIFQKRFLHILLLLLIGSAVYANSINVPFILDDNYSIEFNGKKDLLEHLLHGSPRRVADITFALNYRIHGMQVVGYHLTNLAIHLSTSMLLYLMMVSAVSALRASFTAAECAAEESCAVEQLIPLAVALLFVSHPIQTQAVTYIIQRYTTLATLFYLLSALLYIRARLALERNRMCRKSWLLVAGALAAGLLALGSKQIAVTLPIMLLLLELFLFRGRLINRRFFVACGVLFIVAVGIILVKEHGSSLDDFLFDLRHATSEDLFTSRTTYFMTQTRVVVTYLRLLCLPVGQSLVHDSPIYTSLFATPVMASLALHILLVTIAAILFRMSGKNLLSDTWLRGVLQRLAALGIFWFYIAMAVESSIFPISDVIFEHRIYLPSVGFFMAITALAVLAVQGRKVATKVAWTMLAAVCILLGSMTIARNRIWNDSLTLWEDAVSKSPDKWLAQANLAGEYMSRNMPEKALPLFVHALELHPNMLPNTKVCIGRTLKALNINGSRFTTGEEFILSGGVFDSGSLDYRNLSKWESVINNNMGLAYEYLKEPDKAIKAYRLAVTLNPGYDLAWYNLALLAARLGENGLADEAQGRLQSIDPALAKALRTPAVN
ncbi:MAG: tetratricopeptide repeat protein [Desulfuromonadaceae bacterium]